MNARLTRLAAAAAAAAALLAAPAARADHQRPGSAYPPAAVPAWPQPAPQPAPPPAYLPAPPRPVMAPVADPRFAWQELRAELRQLEEAREHFYATWHGNPWRQRRFEGWYASRRAELERRREFLAGRGRHGEWRERYAWHGERDDD